MVLLPWAWCHWSVLQAGTGSNAVCWPRQGAVTMRQILRVYLGKHTEVRVQVHMHTCDTRGFTYPVSIIQSTALVRQLGQRRLCSFAATLQHCGPMFAGPRMQGGMCMLSPLATAGRSQEPYLQAMESPGH